MDADRNESTVMALTLDTAPSVSAPVDSSVIILWGGGFDARVATICAAAFRQRAISTKIVAVSGNNFVGENGIRLMPDMTLGEAIDANLSALACVLPCTPSRFARVENDPRVAEFLRNSFKPSTTYVVQSPALLELPSLAQLSIDPSRLTLYNDWFPVDARIDALVGVVSSNLYGP